MTEPATTGRSSADWALIHAQHDAFRRDLDGPAGHERRPLRPVNGAAGIWVVMVPPGLVVV